MDTSKLCDLLLSKYGLLLSLEGLCEIEYELGLEACPTNASLTEQWKKTHQLTGEFDFTDKTFCTRKLSPECAVICTCWHLNPARHTLLNESMVLDYIANKQLKHITRPILPSHGIIAQGREYEMSPIFSESSQNKKATHPSILPSHITPECSSTFFPNPNYSEAREHNGVNADPSSTSSLPILSYTEIWGETFLSSLPPHTSSRLSTSLSASSSSVISSSSSSRHGRPSSNSLQRARQMLSLSHLVAANSFFYPYSSSFIMQAEKKTDTVHSILQETLDQEKGKIGKSGAKLHVDEPVQLSSAALSVKLHEEQQKKLRHLGKNAKLGNSAGISGNFPDKKRDEFIDSSSLASSRSPMNDTAAHSNASNGHNERNGPNSKKNALIAANAYPHSGMLTTQPALLPPLRDQSRILRLAGKSMWSVEEIRKRFPVSLEPSFSSPALLTHNMKPSGNIARKTQLGKMGSSSVSVQNVDASSKAADITHDTGMCPILPPCLQLSHPVMLQVLYYHNQRADVTSSKQRYRILHNEDSMDVTVSNEDSLTDDNSGEKDGRNIYGGGGEPEGGRKRHSVVKEGSWCIYTHRQLESPSENPDNDSGISENNAENSETERLVGNIPDVEEDCERDETGRSNTGNKTEKKGFGKIPPSEKSAPKSNPDNPSEFSKEKRNSGKNSFSGPTSLSSDNVSLSLICTDGHNLITLTEEHVCMELRRHLPLPPGSKIVVYNPIVTILDRAVVAAGAAESADSGGGGGDRRREDHDYDKRETGEDYIQENRKSTTVSEPFRYFDNSDAENSFQKKEESLLVAQLHQHLQARRGGTPVCVATQGTRTSSCPQYLSYLMHIDQNTRITVLRGKVPVLLKQYASDARALAKIYAKYDKLNVISSQGYIKFKLTPKMLQYYIHYTNPETGLGSESMYKTPKSRKSEEIPEIVNTAALTNPDCIGYICLLDAGPPLFTPIGVPVVNVLHQQQAQEWLSQEKTQIYSGSTFRTDNIDYSLLSKPIPWKSLPEYPLQDNLLSRTRTGAIINPFIPSWLRTSITQASPSSSPLTEHSSATTPSSAASWSSSSSSESGPSTSFADRKGGLGGRDKESIAAHVYGSNLNKAGISFIPWSTNPAYRISTDPRHRVVRDVNAWSSDEEEEEEEESERSGEHEEEESRDKSVQRKEMKNDHLLAFDTANMLKGDSSSLYHVITPHTYTKSTINVVDDNSNTSDSLANERKQGKKTGSSKNSEIPTGEETDNFPETPSGKGNLGKTTMVSRNLLNIRELLEDGDEMEIVSSTMGLDKDEDISEIGVNIGLNGPGSDISSLDMGTRTRVGLDVDKSEGEDIVARDTNGVQIAEYNMLVSTQGKHKTALPTMLHTFRSLLGSPLFKPHRYTVIITDINLYPPNTKTTAFAGAVGGDRGGYWNKYRVVVTMSESGIDFDEGGIHGVMENIKANAYSGMMNSRMGNNSGISAFSGSSNDSGSMRLPSLASARDTSMKITKSSANIGKDALRVVGICSDRIFNHYFVSQEHITELMQSTTNSGKFACSHVGKKSGPEEVKSMLEQMRKDCVGKLLECVIKPCEKGTELDIVNGNRYGWEKNDPEYPKLQIPYTALTNNRNKINSPYGSCSSGIPSSGNSLFSPSAPTPERVFVVVGLGNIRYNEMIDPYYHDVTQRKSHVMLSTHANNNQNRTQPHVQQQPQPQVVAPRPVQSQMPETQAGSTRSVKVGTVPAVNAASRAVATSTGTTRTAPSHNSAVTTANAATPATGATTSTGPSGTATAVHNTVGKAPEDIAKDRKISKVGKKDKKAGDKGDVGDSFASFLGDEFGSFGGVNMGDDKKNKKDKKDKMKDKK